MTRRHLVIFARYPVAGRGKRRLAAGVGTIQALRFQRVRLRILAARLGRDPRWTTWLAVTPDRSGPWPMHLPVMAQGRGDLGERMASIMRTLPGGPALIIGTDIPGIEPSDIAEAFAALGRNDAVFGPAADGGYWLVGLKRTPTVLQPFGAVRWSTEHALADTERNLAGSRIARLRVLEDVDTASALRRFPRWARVCAAPARRQNYSD